MELIPVVVELTEDWTISFGWGNGYVLIPPGHKLFGVDDEQIYHLNVHGGITFNSPISENFVKKSGISVDYVGYWGIGFDTCHYGDNPTNCNKEYVEKETQLLLKQLEELSK